ncbi:uncharacterized protein LOC130677917 [Microplitis mediator]|uniref:uncharacterized protein LOC130677917 n=1 Tax=Microplitis mediator TaxID=375433 RepID=UPI0025567DA2|nr:uncharacterized protein LOC130677917 [Microplitis mediator]
MYYKICFVLFLCTELVITSNENSSESIQKSLTKTKYPKKFTVAEGIKVDNTSLILEKNSSIGNTNKSFIEQRNVKPRKGVISKTIVARKGVDSSVNSSTLNNTYILSDKISKHDNMTGNIKKLKAKPTVTTVDDLEDDEKVITQPLKSSNKLNYILPIVATIFLLPIVIVIMMFIYNNYCDCWEKRHYRRMDFLVDGMYNE